MNIKPQNNVEELLQKFTQDRNYISPLVEALLAAKIMLPYNAPENGKVDPNAPISLKIVSIGKDSLPCVAVFTSLTALKEVLGEALYVEVPAEKFFRDMQHANIALNPGLDANIMFPSHDVKRIIEIRDNHKPQLLITTPSEIPYELQDALKEGLKGISGIDEAYLCQYSSSARPNDGHILLIGLKIISEVDVVKLDELIKPLTEKRVHYYPNHEFLEITALDETSPFADYFSKQVPFFKA